MMEIQSRKEIYQVTYGNTQFARIDGEWHINTGGNALEWTKLTDDNYDAYIYSAAELEQAFKAVNI